MTSFHYELDFQLEDESVYNLWIDRVLSSEGYEPGEISYIFCSDAYLLNLHKQYLQKVKYVLARARVRFKSSLQKLQRNNEANMIEDRDAVLLR